MHISKEKAVSLRGLCALSVLCSHLISNLNIGTDYKIVNLVSGMMGYIPVTIFFFLSGYGLMMSYTLNGDKYIKEFPRHRLFPYYVKYLVVATIYLLFRIIFSESVTHEMLLKSVLFGGTIVKFGWYFQTQLLLYIFFYLSFSFLKNRKKQLLMISTIIVLFWCVCILTKLDETFFITTPSFLLGIFWTTIVKNVKHDWQNGEGGVFLFVFILIWLLATPFDEPVNAYIRCGIAPCFLIVFIVWGWPKIKVESKVLRIIGSYSYEIYALQGLCFLIVQKFDGIVTNPLLKGCVVLTLVAVFSITFHVLWRKIENILKRIKVFP